MQAIDLRQMRDPGRHVFALAEKLPRTGINQNRLANGALDEEHARRHVGDQGLQHTGDAAIVLLKGSLLGDFFDDTVPAVEKAIIRVVRGESVADPAWLWGRSFAGCGFARFGRAVRWRGLLGRGDAVFAGYRLP